MPGGTDDPACVPRPNQVVTVEAAEISSLDELLGVDDTPADSTAAESEAGRPDKPLPAWRQGYPYDKKLSTEKYEETKRLLQIELLKLQKHVKESGTKLLVICEGRDAAGKGGSIKRFMEHLNPRGARVVALDKPTEREITQWYFQRYVQHLPSGGEIVFMDRSWYNRAGVERVMGYCTPQQYLNFMRETPEFERMLVNAGIQVIKMWFSVGHAEQMRRFDSRRLDPVRQWKLSPTDMASLGRLHRGEGGDVLLYEHRRRPVGRHQEQRQEAGPARGDAGRARPGRLPEQERGRRRSAGPAHRRSGQYRPRERRPPVQVLPPALTPRPR